MPMPATHKSTEWVLPPGYEIRNRFSYNAFQNYRHTERLNWRFASVKNEALLFEAGKLKAVSKLYFNDNEGYLSSLIKQFGPTPKSLIWNVSINNKFPAGDSEHLHVEAACWVTDSVIIGVSAQKGSWFFRGDVIKEEFMEVCVFDRDYWLQQASSQLVEVRKRFQANKKRFTDPQDSTTLDIPGNDKLPLAFHYGPFQFLFESLYAQLAMNEFPSENGRIRFNSMRNHSVIGFNQTYTFKDSINLPAYEWTGRDGHTLYLSNDYIKFVKQNVRSLK
jgi:hypothetical protein